MPFDIDFNVPADTALISGFPATERAMRSDLQGWITHDHNEQDGDHSKVGLIPDDTVAWGLPGGPVNDPNLDGALGFVYTKDINGETELHYKSDAGQIVIITEDGVIAPLALPKAGGTMTGILLMDGATIDLKNLTEKIRLERVAGDAVFRNGLFINATDEINVGDENEPLWLVADDKDGFIAEYPSAPNPPTERFMHEGNMGADSLFDADLLDGVEGEAIFADISDNSGSGFYFQSALQPVGNAAGSTVIAHNLGQAPRLVMASLICSAIDNNYSIGDQISVGSPMQADGNRGIWFGADETNCFYRVGSAGMFVGNKSTGIQFAIDPDDWDLQIRVWK